MTESEISRGLLVFIDKPLYSCIIISLQPGALVKIKGKPDIDASTATFGWPSMYDGNTK